MNGIGVRPLYARPLFTRNTAEVLRSAYRNLGTRLQAHQRQTELSALLALAAAALLVAEAGLSVAWFGRVA